MSSTPIFHVGGAVFLFVVAMMSRTTHSWTLPRVRNAGLSKTFINLWPETQDTRSTSIHTDRRRIISSTIVSSLVFLTASTAVTPPPAVALVKGVAPPKKGGAGAGDKPKCTNVEECQALAEQREAELRAKEEAGPPPLMTASGVKYRDLEDGKTDGPSAKVGDLVSVYFKVLKLGKRSYDGLSGEGTV
jgi:hypothetical protein